ncbi:hypothetical protein OG989_09660 [Micromonospora sp. NBC_01740]|uniref:hypothetical protein n=1 Tax=Micromonospora sp. NBC_01740 TaxID=2975986 RepID=UPI002E104B20|nr:hypothetical protein OG989_09660 [Micromonospora sp. NBC_01740]
MRHVEVEPHEDQTADEVADRRLSLVLHQVVAVGEVTAEHQAGREQELLHHGVLESYVKKTRFGIRIPITSPNTDVEITAATTPVETIQWHRTPG